MKERKPYGSRKKTSHVVKNHGCLSMHAGYFTFSHTLTFLTFFLFLVVRCINLSALEVSCVQFETVITLSIRNTDQLYPYFVHVLQNNKSSQDRKMLFVSQLCL